MQKFLTLSLQSTLIEPLRTLSGKTVELINGILGAISIVAAAGFILLVLINWRKMLKGDPAQSDAAKERLKTCAYVFLGIVITLALGFSFVNTVLSNAVAENDWKV